MALHCHDDNKVLKKVVKLMKKNMDEGEKKLSKEAAGSVGGHAIAVFRTRGESNGKVVTRKLKFVLIHSFRRNKMADVGENRANSSSLHRGWREQLAQSLHINSIYHRKDSTCVVVRRRLYLLSSSVCELV